MAEGSINPLASKYIDIAKTPWIETAPGNKMKILYHDPKTEMLTIITQLAPGCGIPEHTHDDLEQTYVLEGSLVDAEGECTAGNFVIRAKGGRHAPTAPKGCTMLVFFNRPTASLRKMLAKHGLA